MRRAIIITSPYAFCGLVYKMLQANPVRGLLRVSPGSGKLARPTQASLKVYRSSVQGLLGSKVGGGPNRVLQVGGLVSQLGPGLSCVLSQQMLGEAEGGVCAGSHQGPAGRRARHRASPRASPRPHQGSAWAHPRPSPPASPPPGPRSCQQGRVFVPSMQACCRRPLNLPNCCPQRMRHTPHTAFIRSQIFMLPTWQGLRSTNVRSLCLWERYRAKGPAPKPCRPQPSDTKTLSCVDRANRCKDF